MFFATLRMKQPFIFLQIVPEPISFRLTLKSYSNGNSKLHSLTIQSDMFEFQMSTNIFLVLNHILLLFKNVFEISGESNILLF